MVGRDKIHRVAEWPRGDSRYSLENMLHINIKVNFSLYLKLFFQFDSKAFFLLRDIENSFFLALRCSIVFRCGDLSLFLYNLIFNIIIYKIKPKTLCRNIRLFYFDDDMLY